MTSSSYLPHATLSSHVAFVTGDFQFVVEVTKPEAAPHLYLTKFIWSTSKTEQTLQTR